MMMHVKTVRVLFNFTKSMHRSVIPCRFLIYSYMTRTVGLLNEICQITC